MSNVWFTADTHFGHRKAAEFRGFESVDMMDRILTDRWNERVRRGDRIYILGDIVLHKDPVYTLSILERLNGQKYLLRGNHDTLVLDKGYLREQFVWIKDVFMLKVEDETSPVALQNGKTYIWLSHYAHRVWSMSHLGSCHLYGHSHNYLKDLEYRRSFDVGVDAVGAPGPLVNSTPLAPVPLGEVLAAMGRKQWKCPHSRRDEKWVD